MEKVLYFAAYIVTDKGNTDLEPNQILSEKEFNEAYEKYGDNFKAGMGAEAIRDLLAKIDVEALAASLKEELEDAQGQKGAALDIAV